MTTVADNSANIVQDDITRYHGFPWRSRLLRAPKIGLELVTRADFTPVGDLAEVKLGAKTGCDAFFFVKRDGPSDGALQAVRGLAGWQGTVPKADLIPVLRTFKHLDTERDGERARLAAVPRRSDWFYLAVRSNRGIDRDVLDYVRFAERQNVHMRKLVRDNAEDQDHWYRQVRSRVTSRWALPYNSGYDYGAVDNSVRTLLNGRLVGVEPRVGIDAELLGAALNSTFTIVTRLMEGVTTGNEGAFDVGPPAVCVMRLPDPRKMTGQGCADAKAALAELLTEGVLPPAPDRDGNASQLRRRLDDAVLRALGVSAGDVAILRDRVYRGYGRWRRAVEDVEHMMQEHRRALARRGGSRQQRRRG